MAKRFTKKPKTATTDPQQKMHERLRARAERALRKRRREKSHQ